MDREDEEDTKEDVEVAAGGDYWRNIVEKIKEEPARREEPTLEPPILDFSLEQPAEETRQVG